MLGPDLGLPPTSCGGPDRGGAPRPSATRPGAPGARCSARAIRGLRLVVLVCAVLLAALVASPSPLLLWPCVALYGLTSAGYLRARREAGGRCSLGWGIFLLDVGIVGSLALLGDRAPSGLLAACLGLVLMAAVVDAPRHALVHAGVVACAWAGLATSGRPIDVLASPAILAQVVFFLVLAVLVDHLTVESHARAADRDRARAAFDAQAGILRESTQKLREARDTLRARDRLSTLGMLSAGIAHEMKNPLAAILGNLEPAEQIVAELQSSDLGRRHFTQDLEDLGQIVADCQLSSRQLNGVARDLTAVARGCASEVGEVEPAEVLEGARRMLCKSAATGVRIETSHHTSRVLMADRTRLLQVMLNLGSNALDALGSDPEGVLCMRAENGAQGQVVLVVEDNGPGIPDEVRDRVFEPFFTTKPSGRGTGLGLHVVHEIVSALSGTVACETAADLGTTFRVTLPAEEPRGNPGTQDHETDASQATDRGRSRSDPRCVGAHAPTGAL